MGWTKKKKQGGNKFNNTVTVRDGVKFDSLDERYMYDLLKKHGIEFEFQKKIEIVPKYRNFYDKAIQDIEVVVDFYLEYKGIPHFIDQKGSLTEASTIKYKLLGWNLTSKGIEHYILFPDSRNKSMKLVHAIKNGEDLNYKKYGKKGV